MPGRLGPRFAIEALFLIALAVGAAYADLERKWIALVMAVGWLVVALLELAADRIWAAAPPWRRPNYMAAPSPSAEARVGAPAPPAAPPQPKPEPVAEPTPQLHSGAPQEWNLWELERLVNDGVAGRAPTEEVGFLLLALRQFANAEGRLPASFDPIIRESFGDLVYSVG